jgi:hypothetical protein
MAIDTFRFVVAAAAALAVWRAAQPYKVRRPSRA